MGPKKKKAVYNDFYFFMQEQKKCLRREGRSWDTMEDLASICHSRWRLVPDNDKARYKEQAKKFKEEERKNLANKFDAQGRSLLSLEEERVAERRKKEKMLKEINEIVDAAALSKSLPQKKFFILHINTLVEAGEKKYFPCEMALIEFSLKDGISTIFHTFMRPEDFRIPVGYSFSIQQNASEMHGLPMDCEPMQMREASSWSWIVAKFLDVVNPRRFDEAFPPLFTIEDEIEKTEIMLEAIFSWGDHKMRHDVRIYHLNELFNAISQKLSPERQFPKSGGAVFATTQLETDKFTFSPKMACMWHDYDEKPHLCSTTKVKCWAYVIAKQCCEDFGIPTLSRRHRPYDSAEEKADRSKNIAPIKVVNICPWRAPGIKDEDPVVPEHELFGVPKTKAAPAGYTPFVPEGCGLISKKDEASKGLTWGDCDDEDISNTINLAPPKPKPKLNAAGKEPSPNLPSPAFNVWGYTPPEDSTVSSDKQPVNGTGKSHRTTDIPSAVVQTSPAMHECSNQSLVHQPVEVRPPIKNDAENFPSLGGSEDFPSLSNSMHAGPVKGKGKKGRGGRKGQQILTLGVQRMNIN